MTVKRLLVLDDEATVAQILIMGAQGIGYEGRACEEPEAFFAALDDWNPSHVVVDLTLPGMSGLEVLRVLARRGCRARVVVSSGAGASEVEAALRDARSLGLDVAGALPKPFALASLRTLLGSGD